MHVTVKGLKLNNTFCSLSVKFTVLYVPCFIMDIKFAFNINDKLTKIQKESEDLFFDICKNINIKA